MAVSLNSDITKVMDQFNASNSKSAKATELKGKLTSDSLKNASDEELMDVCKSFESYLVEQVIGKVRNSLIPKDDDEEENDYLAMFEDKLYQEYSDTIAGNGELGLARKLYEAMKRDYGGNSRT